MIDLVFIEKVARWLTNTQVKIKTEVAESNAQAKRLAQYLNDLERRIDACERPNLDKEVSNYLLGTYTMYTVVNSQACDSYDFYRTLRFFNEAGYA